MRRIPQHTGLARLTLDEDGDVEVGVLEAPVPAPPAAVVRAEQHERVFRRAGGVDHVQDPTHL